MRLRPLLAGMCLLATMFDAPAPRAQVVEVPIIERGAISGIPQRIASFVEVNADCSENGLPAIHVAQSPAHGRVQALPVAGNTEYPPGSQQYACNLRKLPVLALVYVSEHGYQGNDALTVSVIFPDGTRRVYRYALVVESGTPVSAPSHSGWVHV